MKFIYLVQGKKSNLLKFNHLQKQNSDLVLLSYDEEIVDNESQARSCIFFPKSTWAEGRNKQLDRAIELDEQYDYYIFIDDDVELAGSYSRFESLLERYTPTVGMPLLDVVKSTNRYSSRLKMQCPIAFDQAFLAFSRSAVEQRNVLPLVTKFDDLSWWYSCEINTFLIFNYYYGDIIQFNDLEAVNTGHDWISSESQNNDSSPSSYKGGVTEEGKEIIRNYILERHVVNHHFINSLFHKPEYPKLLYSKSLSQEIKKLTSDLVKGRFVQVFQRVSNWIKAPFYLLYNKVFASQYFIDPKNIKALK